MDSRIGVIDLSASEMDEYEHISCVDSAKAIDLFCEEIARNQCVHVDLDEVPPLNGRDIRGDKYLA